MNLDVFLGIGGLSRSPDLAGADGAAELRFDGAAETGRAIEMLALQMRAYGVGFCGVDLFHHERAVAGAALVRFDGEFPVDGMRTDQGIVLAERVVPVA